MSDTRPEPFFIGEDRALDFLNSIAASWGQEIEWLSDGNDLLNWLEKAQLIPAEAAAYFRSLTDQRSLDEIAARARDLREWFRGIVQAYAAHPLTAEVLDQLKPINDILAQDEAYFQIRLLHSHSEGRGDVQQQGLRMETFRRWKSPAMLLLPIAEMIGRLLCEKDFTHVRKCQGPDCTLWFYDRSKPHARRWCSMALCGNRVKGAAYRARGRQK